MSGWKIDSEKYKRTERLFSHIWTSLLDVGDEDKDGKITISEWIAMWTRYKKELYEKALESENYLKEFYDNNTMSGENGGKKAMEKFLDYKKLKSDGQKL